MSVNIFSFHLFFVQKKRRIPKGPGACSARLHSAGDSGPERAGGPGPSEQPVQGGDLPEAEGAGGAGQVWSLRWTLPKQGPNYCPGWMKIIETCQSKVVIYPQMY